jgi:hypothetical protein
MVLAAILVVCGSGAQTPATVSDADAASAATCPPSDLSSSAACNTVVNDATAVAFLEPRR